MSTWKILQTNDRKSDKNSSNLIVMKKVELNEEDDVTDINTNDVKKLDEEPCEKEEPTVEEEVVEPKMKQEDEVIVINSDDSDLDTNMDFKEVEIINLIDSPIVLSDSDDNSYGNMNEDTNDSDVIFVPSEANENKTNDCIKEVSDETVVEEESPAKKAKIEEEQ
ncbi:FK506-binding protein 5-like isoform X2 [Dipodomys merriami]|uniref:FK506-binding protein 5-like isoform X2 n=1 Tax=Dipodomys merriami TaxID=94247 RepID=UPI003855CF85